MQTRLVLATTCITATVKSRPKSTAAWGASAEKPAVNKPATGEVIHTVKAGETLSKIAQKYGTTYQKIAAYNGIANANLIRVGQKIKIPADTQAAQSFKKGDKVKVLKAVTYTGKAFKTYYDKYDVIEADGDRVVIGIGKTVTAAVNAANLKKHSGKGKRPGIFPDRLFLFSGDH